MAPKPGPMKVPAEELGKHLGITKDGAALEELLMFLSTEKESVPTPETAPSDR